MSRDPCLPEGRYHELFQNAVVGFFRSNLDGSAFLAVNRKFCENTGYSEDDLIRMPAARLWANPAAREQMVVELSRKGSLDNFEVDFITKNRGTRTFLASMRLYREEKYIEGSIADITDGKLAKVALHKREELYHSLFNNMLNGLAYCRMIFDQGRPRDFIYLDVNGAFESLTGLKDVTGKKVSEVIPGILESDPELLEIYGRVALTGRPERFEKYLESLKMWFSVSVFSPEREYFVAAFDVITDRKRVEEALQRSEERYKALFDRSLDLVYVHDFEGNFLDANNAALNLLGYQREEISSLNFAALLSEDQLPLAANTLQEILETGIQKELTVFRLRRKDGVEIYVETKGSLVLSNGTPTSVQSVARDVTDRKLAEARYRKLVSELGIIIDNIPGLVFYKDTKNRFLQVNKYIADAYKMSKEELEGKSMFDLYPQEQAQAYWNDDLQVINTGKAKINIEEVWDTATGARWVNTSKIPYIDETGKAVGIIGISLDITERKRAEAYREMGREILLILNQPGDLRGSMQRILAVLKKQTGFDAVGIRLQDGEDFPYFVQEGFAVDFLLTENTLVERGPDGGLCRDKDGNVSLECTCGLIISGKTDPTNPLFTKGGSCWTNDSFPLLDIPSGEDPRLNPRNRCIHHGYASVALVPIRTKDRIVGLIQFNDRRKGCFTLDAVETLEGIAAQIGTALMRKRAEEERDNLVEKLQKALLEIKTMSGLLPICASCKKIRDDNGYWNRIESYIKEHSEVEFTHSICPECSKRLYPEYQEEK